MEEDHFPCRNHEDRLARIEKSMHEGHKATEHLALAIETLGHQIKTLTGTHLKIIYWLLILVSTAFAGTKAAEVVKAFQF